MTSVTKIKSNKRPFESTWMNSRESEKRKKHKTGH